MQARSSTFFEGRSRGRRRRARGRTGRRSRGRRRRERRPAAAPIAPQRRPRRHRQRLTAENIAISEKCRGSTGQTSFSVKKKRYSPRRDGDGASTKKKGVRRREGTPTVASFRRHKGSSSSDSVRSPRCGATPAPQGAFLQQVRTKPSLWRRFGATRAVPAANPYVTIAVASF